MHEESPNLANFARQKYANVPPARYNLQAIFTKYGVELSDSGYDLLLKCFTYDPKRRISASEALRHEFFRKLRYRRIRRNSPVGRQLKEPKRLVPEAKKTTKLN